MDYLIAFLTGASFTLAEIVTKYDKAPRIAIANIWSLTFLFMTPKRRDKSQGFWLKIWSEMA
ncbi:hypothetical protein [Acanthopleuribacter pedis]|uniref:Uncharacterized protein n=1 Tax=Acanthopleuribacter pedis TaxID=442870 RepID=A0A8J7QDQ0_9BACT|nr:hypothetical protein [Acanthopleuribacter pedis]MBO1321330.1 hypothetical protein [Acanthopleuribacter pedis]